MRQEIVNWVSSFSPAFGAVLAIGLLILPLAIDTAVGVAQPEWTERMFDKLAGPAGATILGVVVIYFMFKLLMEMVENMKVESGKKDATIDALIKKIGGDDK